MYRLIAAMKVPGFSWPTCPNASSSAARKEVYEACPEGWTVGYSDVGHEGNRSVPNKCEKRENLCFNDRTATSRPSTRSPTAATATVVRRP